MPAGAEDERSARRPGEEVPTPLRRDVRLLGDLLGTVIRESGGEALLQDVEGLRRATIALRQDPSPQRRAEVVQLVAAFDLARAAAVARAFTVFFQLVNIAEVRHRVRVLRARGRSQETIDESIPAAVARIRQQDGEAVLARQLHRLAVTLVLTAHPTEARRRAVVETLQRIAALVDVLDDPRLPQSDRAATRRRLLEEITALWRTDHLRPHRPAPLDEVRMAMAVFDETIFGLLPRVYRELERALSEDRSGTARPQFRPFLRWGSWVGADRDGNPVVTADVTRATAEIHAEHVLRGLETSARRISRGLTASERTTPASEEVHRLLADLQSSFPERAAELAERAPDQPHRRALSLLAERLAATRTGRPGRFAGPSEFVDALATLQGSLAAAGAVRLAHGELQHLRWQAESFGFHLASLEVRQHAAVHRRVLDEVAPGVSSDLAALARIAGGGRLHLPGSPSRLAAETLETFRAMRDIQARLGIDACRRYIVSFTSGAEDVVAVLALARLAVPDGSLVVDPVPLFESAEHLRAAPVILDHLGSAAPFQKWLEERGRKLEVMLGYSDSAKEMGFLAANVALHEAQRDLASWARRTGVDLTLFHGRGGALGRGGGPANRAILGQAAGSVAGRFKVTEQGEVIFARYGDPEVARRHLEQVTNAVLLASSPGSEAEAAEADERYGEAAAVMAASSERAYRDLVEEPGFAAFFERVTPIGEIEELQIGSRPARREAGRDLSALRAIPWVFAWNQTRANLPGWYGLGTGLAAMFKRRGGAIELRRMHAEWRFFRSLLENAEISLVKADLPIAQLYLAMGGRADLSERIEAEYRRTVELLLRVTGRSRLLEDSPLLRREVELRNPYVDALSLLQVRFLRELRDGMLSRSDAERARRLILVTINGVAAGLQDTG